ncbi:MAG: FG-GAP repeat protein [Ignavibacteria bacterium]|nr:FG-GAP repeat protein [Ignavibacteria bacterium]
MFSAVMMLLVFCSAGFSQSAFNMGFDRASCLFYSPGYSYWRYADHILSMGDVNRDGIPDLFINACRDSMQTWMIFGTRPGIIDRNNFVRLEGYGTLAKGDVNGDGLPDLVVQSYIDEVIMYPGCDSCPYAIDTVPAWRIHSEEPNIQGPPDFGGYIAIGDLNGDDREDIAIAARSMRVTGGGWYGKVYIYYGGSSRFPSPDTSGIYQADNFRFAKNGVIIEDVNGDGFKDLVIGSNEPEVIGKSPLYEYYDVHYGKPEFVFDPTHPDQRISRKVIPYSTNSHSMSSLNVFDMNADGICDLYIGDHFGYVYYGRAGGFRTIPDRVLKTGDSAEFVFEQVAHMIGDINGDGYVDFLLSGIYRVGVGMAFIYLGSSLGMESYPAATAFNPMSGNGFSSEVAHIGDIDGDGLAEFAATFVTDGETGFAVYGGKSWRRTSMEDIPISQAPSITAFPNPFTDHTTMIAVNEVSNSSTLKIYDIYGREIRSLNVARGASGEARIMWDGFDARGVKVSPGLYITILETSRGLLKGKVVKR